MTDPDPKTVTRLLSQVSSGEPGAGERLWTLVHDELRALAAAKMAKEAPGHTLQPTALVHEVYGRLFGEKKIQWNSRRHFFSTAARAMERILIDHARGKGRLKRGGARHRVPLDDIDDIPGREPAEEMALADALVDFEQINPRAAEIVRLRYFVGLTTAEVAEVLGVSQRTVEGDWFFARAWLRREIMRGETSVPAPGAEP